MIIKEFNIDLNYINNNGESRPFTVVADKGSIFSLMVKKQTGSVITYYDFNTTTFVSSQKRLKNRKLITGSFSGSILFPAGGLSSGNNPNTYTLMLFAESAFGTSHALVTEARFPDGTLDLNSSTGSNSNLLQKILYQFPDTTISIGAQSPNLLSGFSGMNVSGEHIVVQRGNNTGKIPFKITCTLGSTKTGKIKRQPVVSDLAAFVGRTLGEPMPIPGVTANQGGESGVSLTINNLPRNNSNTFDVEEPGAAAIGMTVKGVGIDDTDHPVIITGISGGTITVSKNLTIANVVANASATANDIRYRRWNCSEIQGLVPGMIAYSGGAAGSKISRYLDTTDQLIETTDSDGGVKEKTITTVNFDVPALDVLGYKPVFEYGVLKSQQGVITLDTPQIVVSNRNVGTKFYAYGPQTIKSLFNSTLNITDLEIEIEKVVTTVNDANADGATAQGNITVASSSGIMDDVSVMSGVNITATAADPTVTNVNGNILTVSPNQFLQNGQTLTFTGAGRVINITGNINFTNIDSTNFSISFDLEKLITAV